MPYKDAEKRRAYDRKRKAEKRAREKAREIDIQHERGNINYGPRAKATPFMSFEEFKRQNPKASFKLYLERKTEFAREHRVQPVRKISEDEAIDIRGVNLWHGDEKKAEEIRQHHEEADAFEEFLQSPEHPPRQSERYNWQEDLEEQIEKLNKNMKAKKEDEEENE